MIGCAHEYAMSENEVQAAQGRAVKLVMPVIARWLEDEISRGTPPTTMLVAANSLISSIFLSSTHFAVRGDPSKEVVAMALDAAIVTLRDTVEQTQKGGNMGG